jgi:hypothetical protein
VRCRRDFHHRQEQAEIERERAEVEERRRFELDVRFHGKREAKRRAKERLERQEYWKREREKSRRESV